MTKAQLHAEALREFDNIETVLRQERLQCLNDRRFCDIAGAQWEGPLQDQFENRPRFEVNKVNLAVMRVINEYRNNRMTVDFLPKEGAEYDKLADTCNGLYRADEQDSCAEEAYDNAFEEAVKGGFGAFRLRNEYTDEEDEDDDTQRICIEPIFDADTSVYFDLNAKRQDKSDAKRCFVLTAMTPAAYKEEWGDDPQTWPKSVTRVMFDWYTPEVVYVAEYYRVEEVSDTVVTVEMMTGKEEKLREGDEGFEEALKELKALGGKVAKRKKVKTRKVHKYILSGGKILEDCGYIAGKNIPIVPVYGKRWFVDNVERCMGIVRLAKDAQRLKNMQLSKLAEISALSSIEKPIFVPEQVAGHQVMWSEDNIKNYPYLLVNTITDASGNAAPAGPVAYTKSSQIPPAMAALLQVTDADMNELLGNAQAAERMVSHVTGKAIDMIQQSLGMQSYVYISNMGKAVKRAGEIWLSMAKDVFVEPKRKMKVIDEAGKMDSIELMTPTIDEESGDIEYENDLSDAQFDVSVDIGPTAPSKRAATVQSITGMMAITQDPEMLKVLSAMAMLNMEGEGISDVRDYFRKQLVTMGVLKPTEQEAQELQQALANQQPSPEAIYLQAEAQKANALATKAQADTVLTLAKAEETRAKTEDTLAKTAGTSQDNAMKLADRIESEVARIMPQQAAPVMPMQNF